jgi:hypothetical protein
VHDCKLTKDELIALVLAKKAQIEALTRRLAEVEAKLGQRLIRASLDAVI